MAKTALDLTPEEWKAYNPVREHDWHAAERWQRAWEFARAAAALLRERFGASRVLAFGSVTRKRAFTPWSDVDLAAWGIAPDRFFEAVGAIEHISTEFEVDLVDPETCRPSLRQRIERDGIEP